MDRKHKFNVFLLVLLAIIVIITCVYKISNGNLNINNDSSVFRREYMQYNDKINELTGKPYLNVIISENNSIKYVTDNETAKILESGSGLIYFGFATCKESRLLVPSLIDIAEDKNETIYYLDISDISSKYELRDNKISKIKEGSDGYHKILKLLDDKLDNFYLEDELGNKYDIKEKRLTSPTLVKVNKGKIVAFHTGLVSSYNSLSDKLTDKQVKKLQILLENIIDSK